jgi:hypothetical protein
MAGWTANWTVDWPAGWVLGFLSEGPPPPLPAAPALEHHLFESPGIGAGLLALVAVAIGATLVQRGRARVGIAVGAGLLAVAGSWVGLATAVTTEREALNGASRELVVAVARADGSALQRILHPEAALAADGWMWTRRDRDGILALLERIPGGEMEAGILASEAVLDGPNVGRVQLRVRTRAEGFLDIAWWRLDWRREPNGYWRVARIERLTRGLGGG